ncbi:hypothetical protein F2P81_026180 [Scophthalmus maximus]|uniref:Uncharacterized protein n=1 Tax=Scophthalmus maximus TaxID=52904 RepID=A0A6A4RN82_SCOMX|nr:hypothetical protein F2P81_026180 [Scophthalmus maximus]
MVEPATADRREHGGVSVRLTRRPSQGNERVSGRRPDRRVLATGPEQDVTKGNRGVFRCLKLEEAGIIESDVTRSRDDDVGP